MKNTKYLIIAISVIIIFYNPIMHAMAPRQKAALIKKIEANFKLLPNVAINNLPDSVKTLKTDIQTLPRAARRDFPRRLQEILQIRTNQLIDQIAKAAPAQVAPVIEQIPYAPNIQVRRKLEQQAQKAIVALPEDQRRAVQQFLDDALVILLAQQIGQEVIIPVAEPVDLNLIVQNIQQTIEQNRQQFNEQWTQFGQDRTKIIDFRTIIQQVQQDVDARKQGVQFTPEQLAQIDQATNDFLLLVAQRQLLYAAAAYNTFSQALRLQLNTTHFINAQGQPINFEAMLQQNAVSLNSNNINNFIQQRIDPQINKLTQRITEAYLDNPFLEEDKSELDNQFLLLSRQRLEADFILHVITIRKTGVIDKLIAHITKQGITDNEEQATVTAAKAFLQPLRRLLALRHQTKDVDAIIKSINQQITKSITAASAA